MLCNMVEFYLDSHASKHTKYSLLYNEIGFLLSK
jgi:hypothetical protein